MAIKFIEFLFHSKGVCFFKKNRKSPDGGWKIVDG
jgi:hypothetical protein